MSKQSLPKSLLSAYFDGEVSAEERAAVSRAARSSPAVQQVLNDYAQLSKCLKSLNEEVRTAGLREAVLARIDQPEPKAASVEPVPVPARIPLPVPALGQRRWIPVAAAGVLVATAAGLLLMIGPGVPPQADHAEFAANRAERAAGPREAALALNSGRRAAAETTPFEGGAMLSRQESAGDAGHASPDESSLPEEEWLTQLAAKTHRIPQPGELMNYLRQVADETVWVKVEVVDVQTAAGQIQLLLKEHGIVSPAEGEAVPPGPAADPNVAILVESEWERVSPVLDELETQGFRVAMNRESSAQRALLVQRSRGAGPARAPEFPAPSERPLPAADAALARSGDPQAKPSNATERLDSDDAAPRMFHAQLETRVSDEFVEELDQRQADATVVAESAMREATEGDAVAPPAVRSPKPWDPLASRSPVRMVFLIKKSGNDK